jgi:2,5-diketo-D-gluconate reductase B
VAHLQSNLQAASIELDAEDLAQLQAIPKNQRLINPDFAPQWDA